MNDRKKHIAFYIGSLNKGGAERVFVNLAEYFQKEGCQVTMITQYQKENEYELPAGVTRVISDLTPEEEGGRLANFVNRFKKLRRIYKEYAPDLVLSCIGKNNFMSMAAAFLQKTKTVISVVADPKEEYYNAPMRLLANLMFPFADGAVFQTTDAVAWFSKPVQKKAVILKNSLNSAFLLPRFEGERKKEIVAVGRMDKNKNQRMLLNAFAKIADRFPDHTVTIYGKGELKEALAGEARQLGIGSRVNLPGTTTDVPGAIRQSEVFVLTSNSEGMPNTLLEAMALGLPCISTDCPCGGPKDLIQSGENGFLVPVGDADALAETLALLLGDKALQEKVGKEAWKLQESYTPEKVNSQWKEYFEKVLSEK